MKSITCAVCGKEIDLTEEEEAELLDGVDDADDMVFACADCIPAMEALLSLGMYNSEGGTVH